MRPGGRLAPAIEVLTDFDARRVPMKTCLQDWARGARFAGSGDRAWISGLALDALRRRASLAASMDEGAPRAAALGALRWLWGWDVETIAAAAGEAPHGPGALSDAETAALSGDLKTDIDAPEWLHPHLMRVFGEAAAEEVAALSARAPVDLRVNHLKSDDERAVKALSPLGATPSDVLAQALRIPAPAPEAKAPALEASPAYAKGWVEVQDLGSQIAALAAGEVAGRQVLDYCAGGGGKTLALAAQMGNSGQVFAYDADARRLAPIFERLRRAGARNVQVRSPAENADLSEIKGRMDVVFIDAPCTGTGTWRRKPDAKWRLTEDQLQRRMDEQDAILRAAAEFVKPGGVLVYATCSVLMTENEDRLAAFTTEHPAFSPEAVLPAISETGELAPGAGDRLAACSTPDGALRLTPRRLGADGFFVARLRRA